MMSFIETFQKYNLRDTTTSIKKIQEILSSVSLSDVGNLFRDGPFTTDVGIVNLHPTNATQWVAYIKQNSFDFYGCSFPNELSKYIVKRNGCCSYSE